MTSFMILGVVGAIALALFLVFEAQYRDGERG